MAAAQHVAPDLEEVAAELSVQQLIDAAAGKKVVRNRRGVSFRRWYSKNRRSGTPPPDPFSDFDEMG